jgi:hypothetical protein
MTCNRLGVFQESLILKVYGDPGGSEAVAADGAGKPGIARPTLDHSQYLLAAHAAVGQLPPAVERAKEGAPFDLIEPAAVT